MRTFVITIFLFTFYTSCTWKPFPDKSYEIEKSYRNLFSCYKVGDTLIFKSSENNIDSFVISNIDSIINDRKGYFINTRNSKSISVHYRQIPVDKWQWRWTDGDKNVEHSEDGTFIDIIRFAESEKTEYYFNFKEFRCSKNEIPKLLTDTIELNHFKLTNYYKINNCQVQSNSPYAIQVCYSSLRKGLVAFKTNEGIYWTRQN